MSGDPREPLGRTFHENGRLTVNAEREKPFAVGPWEDRTDEQREIDMRGASAVAVRAVRDAGIDFAAERLNRAAEIRKAVAAERAWVIALADTVKAVATADEGTRCFFADQLRQRWEYDRG